VKLETVSHRYEDHQAKGNSFIESILLRLLGYVTGTKKATSTKENTQMTEFTIHASFKNIEAHIVPIIACIIK
jgi:hypothetical protein